MRRLIPLSTRKQVPKMSNYSCRMSAAVSAHQTYVWWNWGQWAFFTADILTCHSGRSTGVTCFQQQIVTSSYSEIFLTQEREFMVKLYFSICCQVSLVMRCIYKYHVLSVKPLQLNLSQMVDY